MRRVIIVLISLFIIFALGCGKKTAQNMQSAPAAKQSTSAVMDSGTAQEQQTNNSVKKIIQCELNILVDEIYSASVEIENKAKEFGGYIENQDLNEYNAHTSVRIPSQKLDSFLGFVEKTYELKNKRIFSQDITEEYVDNDARLKNLKAEEAQIIEIMKKAITVEEILKVQSELYKVRGEIESLEAKKKMWDRQVDYSLVGIYLQKKQIAKDSSISIINGSDFWKAIIKGFKNSIIYLIFFLQSLLIFLISNIIYILIFIAAVYIIIKKFVKNKKIDFKSTFLKDKNEE